MKISNRIHDALGILLVIIALVIQIWMSIFQIDSDTAASILLFQSSIILLITGSVQLATLNVNRLFAIYHRIDYATALIGLVGFSILLVFREYLESLLSYPNRMILYFLILDFLWILFLGMLLKRFKTISNKDITTN
ncbi:MAG: hypothetical protein ACFFER_12405 [Candidatus Thorarchaeota archaeon]